MRILQLLVLLSACKSNPDFKGTETAPKGYYYAGDWTYVGPGSMGAFTSILIDPDDTDVLYAGSDVGGVYYYDGAGPWTNITGHMKALPVSDLAILQGNGSSVPKRLYVATNGGLFLCDSPSGSGCASTHHVYNFDIAWTYGDPFENYDDDLKIPLKAVAIDAVEPYRVWVGTGHTAKPFSATREDVAKVYVSSDGGFTFMPTLGAPYGAATCTPASSGPPCSWDGAVFDIVVHPEEAEQAWVTMDSGLYYTPDGGDNWAVLGQSTIYCTSDGGQTWVDPSDTGVTDDCQSVTWPTAGTGSPLPTQAEGRELREMAISIEDSEPVLYVVVWDQGDYTTASCTAPSTCTSSTFVDSAFECYAGGVWRSTDLGVTWTQILNNDGGSGWPQYLCSSGSGTPENTSWDATLYTTLAVNPAPAEEDPIQVFLGAVASKAGVYRGEYDGTSAWTWTWISNANRSPCDASGTVPNCFNDEPTLNISGTANQISIYDIAVDWTDTTNPTFYAMNTRGGLRATWNGDSTRLRYEFTAMGSTWNSTDDTWTSTGLDDACAEDVLAPLDNGDSVERILLAVRDGDLLMGELTASGSTEAWTSLGQIFDDAWESSGWDIGDGNSLVYDDGTANGSCTTGDPSVYMTHHKDDTENSILMGQSDSTPWDDWSIIGGFLEGSTLGSPDTTTTYDSFSPSTHPLSLAVDYSEDSCPGSRRILAGTKDGVWLYDGTDDWSQISCVTYAGSLTVDADNCSANDIYTSPSDPSYAWFVYDCNDDDEDGAYYIDLSTSDCYQLSQMDSSSTAVTYQSSALTFATTQGTSPTTYLIISTQSDSSGGPKMYSVAMDPASPSAAVTWTNVFDQDMMYPGGVPPIQFGALEHLHIKHLETDPNRSNDIVAAFFGDTGGTNFDGHNAEFIVRSIDAGQNWFTVAGPTSGLPNRSTRALRFDFNGEWLYHGSCSSLYRGEVNAP